MSIPLSFLLFGAVGFLVLALIGITRGVKIKERAYQINGLVCILLSVWLVLLYYSQLVLSIGFFIGAAILGLANLSKSIKAASREAVTSHKETDITKPLSVADLFSWGGWFKISTRWGIRKALAAYILFNLGVIWVIPLALLFLNIGSPSFIAIIGVFMTVVVLISSVPIFRQQITKNLPNKMDGNNGN
ncbi:MAG: hypothetical protein QM398_02340 [Thermoproteota archaeon]|nr:hypothetical protein [Thermoproteota archaeon]NLD66187.1 hypothetical protein [Thermoproteota archaeon]